MKYCALSFIIILFLAPGCQKEINKTPDVYETGSNVSETNYPTLLDTLASCKWVFTEYHDKVSYQSQPGHITATPSTSYMVIMSDGSEAANIGMDGKIYLNRGYDFKFADISYFSLSRQAYSFVNSTYSAPYQDTVNYNLIGSAIVLSKPVKYLPDTMSIVVIDTACLLVSGMLHVNGYDVKRSIVLYKNTRWYGGYRNYSELLK